VGYVGQPEQCDTDVMLKAGTWTKVAVVLMFKLFFSMQHLSSLGPSLKPKGFFYHVEPNFFHSPSFTATMASHQASAPHRRKVDIQQSSHR
jgi:hypothetical protein